MPSKPGKYVLEEVVILIQLESFCATKWKNTNWSVSLFFLEIKIVLDLFENPIENCWNWFFVNQKNTSELNFESFLVYISPFRWNVDNGSNTEIEILDNAVTLKITTTWFYTDSPELESTKFDSFEQNPKKSNLIFVRKESQTNNLILLWTLCSNFGFDSLLGWNPNLDLILCWFKVARKRVWFSLIFSFGSKLVFEFNSNRVLNTHLQEKKATCCNKPWYVFEVDLLLSSEHKKSYAFEKYVFWFWKGNKSVKVRED